MKYIYLFDKIKRYYNYCIFQTLLSKFWCYTDNRFVRLVAFAFILRKVKILSFILCTDQRSDKRHPYNTAYTKKKSFAEFSHIM